ncbi:YceI family protein [Aliikangiella sp. IMCC44632]
MNTVKALVALSILVFSSSCSYILSPRVESSMVKLTAGEYQIDPTHSSVIFKVNHMGLSTFVGRFNQFNASLTFDPKNKLNARLHAWVATDSIDVNNPELEQQLVTGTWFNSSVYPKAELTTLSVEATPSENQLVFNAKLKLLGVEKPIKLLATFHGGADNFLTGFYTLGFSAQTELLRSDFSMDSYIPMVGDSVKVEIYAEFQRR